MLHFGDVAIVVADAKKAHRWYTQKLGFTSGDREGHWVTVMPPRSKVVLHLCEMDKLEPGNTGIGFTVRDVPATEKELRRKGVKFTRKSTKTEWGTYAMFRDPDGNEFWLTEG
ncbi:MAG: VOC family protein [Thermoplasmata archaeon]|nr:VOC family protein [Thermoplasmata archaeon]